MNFSDKKVAILGFGVEGVSSATFLAAQGAKVTIHDARSLDAFDTEAQRVIGQIPGEHLLGSAYLSSLDDYEIIVRSPGIKRQMPELVEAEEKGAIITSQIQLFLDLCPAQVIGVTGTKGKGTTSSLIYEILKHDGREVFLGGNIGQPPLDFLSQLTKDSWVVLELSSFQLQGLTKSPHIAVMLMIVSEHMDYHSNMEEYVDAKRNILKHQSERDFAILNRDYIASNESDIHTSGKVYYVSRERSTVEDGCFVRDEKLFITTDMGERMIMEANEVFLPGKHNLENVCAAIQAAILAGVSEEKIVPVVKTFKGLEHRLELVRDVDGVLYYDDSFSTTPETAIAAVESFTKPEIVILGGASKKSDFTQLGEVIVKARNIKAIIGVGEEWPTIKSAIEAAVLKAKQEVPVLYIEGATNMQQIVQAAAKIATTGDIVLLSPACASFDMFENYKERGDLFKKEVLSLEISD